MTILELCEKYGGYEHAIRAYFEGKLDPEDEETVRMKCNPVGVVTVSHRMIMEELQQINNYLIDHYLGKRL